MTRGWASFRVRCGRVVFAIWTVAIGGWGLPWGPAAVADTQPQLPPATQLQAEDVRRVVEGGMVAFFDRAGVRAAPFVPVKVTGGARWEVELRVDERSVPTQVAVGLRTAVAQSLKDAGMDVAVALRSDGQRPTAIAQNAGALGAISSWLESDLAWVVMATIGYFVVLFPLAWRIFLRRRRHRGGQRPTGTKEDRSAAAFEPSVDGLALDEFPLRSSVEEVPLSEAVAILSAMDPRRARRVLDELKLAPPVRARIEEQLQAQPRQV